mmetsp:Transcript_18665/g.34633  ORF Transcript_18665/g.34633 Transcript_18665/m.34633 type:complete len:121 (+) Transcript_18665:255-617(+)
MAGRKSRHYRDESDLLLGVYSSTLSTSSKDNANSNGNGNDHSQQHNDYYTTPNTPPPIKQSSFSKLQQCRTPIDNDDNNNNNNNNQNRDCPPSSTISIYTRQNQRSNPSSNLPTLQLPII